MICPYCSSGKIVLQSGGYVEGTVVRQRRRVAQGGQTDEVDNDVAKFYSKIKSYPEKRSAADYILWKTDSIEEGSRKRRSRRRKNAEKKDEKKTYVLVHAVVVPSARLSWRKINLLKELEERYRELVVQFVEYGFKHGVTGHVSLRKALYEELRRRHPDLPSHYIYTAAQDAATRIKSFMALKREGRAKTERPEVRRISIWLDDHLWIREGFTEIVVATHRGWVTIPLWPTKQFWKHINGG